MKIKRSVAAGALCALLVAAPVGGREGPERRGMGSEPVVAQRKGAHVVIRGWATFSGATLAAAKDPKADGGTLAAPRGAEIIGADFLYRPEQEDFFFRMDVTEIPAVSGPAGTVSAGDPGVLYALDLSVKNAPYQIRVHKVGNPSPDAPTDPAFGLFQCDEATCTEVARLRGGYGTTGERIVVSLPLEVLRRDGTKVVEGDPVSGLNGFTATAPYVGVVTQEMKMDEVRLLRRPEVTIPAKSVTVTVRNSSVRAKLRDGWFTATFPARLFAGRVTPVQTRTCLGRTCRAKVFKVRA